MINDENDGGDKAFPDDYDDELRRSCFFDLFHVKRHYCHHSRTWNGLKIISRSHTCRQFTDKQSPMTMNGTLNTNRVTQSSEILNLQ